MVKRVMSDQVHAMTEQVEDAYALSPMQQGMLFHSLLARHSGVDIEQIFCDLREDLDVAAFERAWRRVVERHAILRTSFVWQNGSEPRQEVHRHVRVHFEQKDWSGIQPRERGRRLEEFLQADRRRGFELNVAPPLRLALIRAGATHYWFIFTFHHLLLDGRALTVVLKEAFAFYEAFAQGYELELAPPRPYRHYLDWLQTLDLARAHGFWRERLRGFMTPTPLPMARSPGEATVALDSRGELEAEFPEALTTRLYAVAKENQVTLNTLVQGAWALLLSRYSGMDDVVFGAIRACRHVPLEGADSIVGLFINTVPVRVRIEDDATLVRWLQALREQWLALRDREHTPLVKVQGWSEVPRGQPLFETLFNFQEPSWDAALRASGGHWKKRNFSIRSQSNYPLVVDAYGGRVLLIKMLYDRGRFTDDAIARLLGHFRTVLEAMARGAHQRLGDLPVLTEVERRRVLVEWNRTQADYPQDQCVHHLFEEQVRQAPERIAVVDDCGELTYASLKEQAGQLAGQLREWGVGPDVLVGVLMERSTDMVVALLAILKAGGAYVPMDPAYPQERLAFMIEDARMPVLLTQRKLSGRIPAHRARVLCVDDSDREARVTDPRLRETSRSQPESQHPDQPSTSLAYVIYTSGSSGQPKGVQIEHRSLVNLVTWHRRAYRVTPVDRATQLASPAFDASVWELWPYLAAGASIYIPDDETRVSPPQLVRWLAAKNITLAFLPAPLAEAMLDEPWPESIALRALLTGGEKLKRRPPENFPCPLINHYGPTENTVVTTWGPVTPGAERAAAPPIGRPIANTQAYILDKHLRPVPVGVPGELFIGGDGLARGYLNRPELTREKFIEHPFQPGSRLYRSGDLARYLGDGNIEYLGRLDLQVKIRGNRIELEEIESVLNQHPAVRQVAVTARHNQLVAHLVLALDHAPGTAELRQFLARKLPDYMVPSAFVWLDQLPLTPNGKLDRHALPEPEFAGDGQNVFVAPRTPAESALTEIWRDVLGVARAGVHDNFFELGGHSLVATQVMSRVRTAFNVNLPLRALFENPTVATFAAALENAGRASGQSGTRIPRRTNRQDGERAARQPVRATGPLLPTENRS